MKDILKSLTTSSVVVGTALGVTITINDVYNILGVILLIFQIGIIIAQVIIKLKEAMTTKDITKVKEALEDGKKDLENLKGDNADGNSKS